MKRYLILILVLLCGCFSNIKKTFNQRDQGSLKESGFFDGKVDLEQPSIDLVASGNATVLIGDRAIQTKMKTETEMKIDSDSAWDMTIDEAYEKYSTWTFIFAGTGLLLIVLAIKKFEKTSVGRVFSTSMRMIDKQLQHIDPKSDDYRAISKIKDGLEEKKESFFKRG